MREYIDVTGKTEDEAISKALAQLGLDRDDVSVEILERAKSGFLGLGSCPAKVRVSYGPEEEENARYEARQAERQKRMEEGRRQQAERKNQEERKQTLKEKQKAAQNAKAAKAAKAGISTTEAGRVGNRPYARGRAYKADRYDEKE